MRRWWGQCGYVDAKTCCGPCGGGGVRRRDDLSAGDIAGLRASRGFHLPLLSRARAARALVPASALGLGMVPDQRRVRLAALFARQLGMDRGERLVLGFRRAVRVGCLSL